MPGVNRLIYLDPGHGGSDPGAIGPSGTREADINLAVATKLKRLLAGKGFGVEITRDGDNFISLQDRATKANAASAAIFVSIHCNAASDPNAGGTETYHATGSKPGKELAKAIHGPLVVATGLRDRGVKTASFYVLRCTKMPAVLIELAFISNEKEERLLKDAAFQEKVAEAVAKGIMTAT